MNIEEAKLFLQACRPGGEDAGDPIFSDALEQARRDPELGRWLSGQREFDDAMRTALQAELPPPDLREAIRLSGKVVRFPQETASPIWRNPVLLTLAATLLALLAMSALFMSQFDRDGTGRMTVAGFTHQVLDLKESGGIRLGKTGGDPAEIRAWLAERGAPSRFDLPPGLRNLPGLGCQTYSMDGTKVSLVCFMLEKDQIVHLFVVDKNALQDAASEVRPTMHTENGHTWATWTSGGKRFVLTGKDVTEETLRQLI